MVIHILCVIIWFKTENCLLCSMETITLGDKRIGIKTSVLEEKATACNMLCCYADELKEGFFHGLIRLVLAQFFSLVVYLARLIANIHT